MKYFIFTAFSLLILIGCNTRNSSNIDMKVPNPQADVAFLEEAPQVAGENINNNDAEEPVKADKQINKIIKEATISFEVDDYSSARKGVDSLVNRWGGYISKEDESRTNYRVSNTMTIRVGSENFDNLVNAIGMLPKRIESKSVNMLDVTEEYIDIEARLKTKREMEQRYYEILKKAKNIDEVLKVENEIRQLREEIESREGRLKYLRDRVAYSTITLYFYQQLEYKYVPDKETGFFTRLIKALDKGWKGLLSFIIGLFYIWPMFLLLTVGYFSYKVYRRKKTNK